MSFLSWKCIKFDTWVCQIWCIFKEKWLIFFQIEALRGKSVKIKRKKQLLMHVKEEQWENRKSEVCKNFVLFCDFNLIFHTKNLLSTDTYQCLNININFPIQNLNLSPFFITSVKKWNAKSSFLHFHSLSHTKLPNTYHKIKAF